MIISGLDNNYYLSGNDIWIKVASFATAAIRLDLEFTNITTGKSLGPLRLYPDPNQEFRFNISLPIRALQPNSSPNRLPNPINPTLSYLNTMSQYSVKFTVILEGGGNEIITLERYFIRGGKERKSADNWYFPTINIPLVIGGIVKWKGVLATQSALLRYFCILDEGLINWTNYIEENYEVKERTVQNCDYKIIRFLNSLGGYQYWIFESWEVKKKAKPKKSVGRIAFSLKENKIRSLGASSEKMLILKTKVPFDLQEIIEDLIDSPDIMLLDSAGVDNFDNWFVNGDSWHRIEIDSNDTVINNVDRVYLNEITFTLPNYVNRDL